MTIDRHRCPYNFFVLKVKVKVTRDTSVKKQYFQYLTLRFSRNLNIERMLTVVFFINIIRLYLFNHQKKCRTVIIKVKVTEAFKCKIYQKIVHFATKCVAELWEKSESLSKSELILLESPINVDNARPFTFSIWIIFKVTIGRYLGSPILRE